MALPFFIPVDPYTALIAVSTAQLATIAASNLPTGEKARLTTLVTADRTAYTAAQAAYVTAINTLLEAGGGGAVESIAGLGGIVGITSPDSSVTIGVSGQNITLEAVSVVGVTQWNTRTGAVTLTAADINNLGTGVDIGIVSAGILGPANGGTGLSEATPADGYTFIGNGGNLVFGAITGSGGVTVTLGAGTINISLTNTPAVLGANTFTGLQTIAYAGAELKINSSSGNAVLDLEVAGTSVYSISAGTGVTVINVAAVGLETWVTGTLSSAYLTFNGTLAGSTGGGGSVIFAGGFYATKNCVFNGGLEVSNGTLYVEGGSNMLRSLSNFTSGAGTSAGTLTNAPSAGNPTSWIGINDNGTQRYIPAW